jgi:hypothetical protein
VDYAGVIDPFALRVAAAHFRIVLGQAQSLVGLGHTATIVVRTSRHSFLIHAVAEGYALFVQFAKRAGLTGWRRAIAVYAWRLCTEAGWSAPRAAWFPVEVHSDGRLRPMLLRVGALERRIEIMGAVASAEGREKAWRVRVETGIEAMLVREPGGAWYADEALA